MKANTDLRLRKSDLFRRLGYEPHPSQVLVHKSRAPRRVVACGTRFGKSTIGAYEVVAAMLEPRDRCLGWLIAPTYSLAQKISRRVIELLHEHFAHRILSFSPREHSIVVANLGGGISELRSKSADSPASLLGDSVDFAVVDEAAQIQSFVWDEALAPRLLDRRGWCLLLSTPTGGGWFFQEFRRGARLKDADYESFQFPTSCNPYIRADLILAEQRRLPAEVFAAQYLAQFVDVPVEECAVCHGPRQGACSSIILYEDAEPKRCPECNGCVHENGETAVDVWPDGTLHTTTINIHKPLPHDRIPPLPDFTRERPVTEIDAPVVEPEMEIGHITHLTGTSALPAADSAISSS